MKKIPFLLLSAVVLSIALLSAAAVYPLGDRGALRNLLYTYLNEVPAPSAPSAPAPPEVVEALLDMARVGEDDVLYDIGCGDGRIVVAAAQKFGIRGIGVDPDPERITESIENARAAEVADRVRFFQGDLFAMDLSGASVVTLSLLPAATLKLRPKLLREVRPGTRVLSRDSDMGSWRFDRVIMVKDHPVYFWVVPANMSGVWKGEFRGRKGKGRYVLRIRQQFQKVGGTLSAGGVKAPLSRAEMKGSSLRFTVARGLPGMAAPVRFEGRVEGDGMQGSMESGGRKRAWTAVRDGTTIVPLDIPEGHIQTVLYRRERVKTGE
ncbi:MAG: class I SAM-dependent methyltransferase [Thermodesulfovibrionales bacterium]